MKTILTAIEITMGPNWKGLIGFDSAGSLTKREEQEIREWVAEDFSSFGD